MTFGNPNSRKHAANAAMAPSVLVFSNASQLNTIRVCWSVIVSG